MNRVARATRYLLAALWLLAGAVAAVQCGLVGGAAYAADAQLTAGAPAQDGEEEHCEVHCPTGSYVSIAGRDDASVFPAIAPPQADIAHGAIAAPEPAAPHRPWPDYRSRPSESLTPLATDRLLI